MKKITAIFLMTVFALAPLGMRPACADDALVSGQLAAIEKKQDLILQELEALKSELQIVKIRITSR